ncbi:hypothetical protein FQN57_002407 [Myotisia sp. PD_48]|nr:hypothetical protein FQN57_002407 [Myotisia sp. PD_48]
MTSPKRRQPLGNHDDGPPSPHPGGINTELTTSSATASTGFSFGASSGLSSPSTSTDQPVSRDEDSDDFDEAYSDSMAEGEAFIGDDTRTLSSYITKYRFENGRRYHSYRDGAYWGPNDEVANNQQDLAHHMYLLTLDGKLHLAPLSHPQEILDVGTGTGIWAIDMADEYPSAKVTGFDLSPIQPTFVPPNCVFEVDDVNLFPWTYPRNHFDLIHIREMFGCIPDWDEFFLQCFQCLKPGGYIEIVEHSVQPVSDDDTVGPDHFYTRWGQTVVEAGTAFGKSFSIWKESKDRLKKAGFVDVVEYAYKWPMNGWSQDRKLRDLGRWNQVRLHDGVEGYMLRLLTAALGWPYERAQIFLAQMRAMLLDYKANAYIPGTVVYARKPPDTSVQMLAQKVIRFGFTSRRAGYYSQFREIHKKAMKALVYNGKGKIAIEDRPKPAISLATDAIVRVKHTSICGTDLHIIKGDVPTVEPGRILGHEGVGVVDAVGASVPSLKVGDSVLISCISACGSCSFCRRGMCSHCETGGWILGNTIDGVQAEYVRVPHATSSLYKLPKGVDLQEAVMLSDALPTGLECGTINGKVQPGSSVVVIGAGAVGLSAMLTAQLYTPSVMAVVDIDDTRLATASQFGATHTVNSKHPEAVQRLLGITEKGRGFDAVIEAVGVPGTFALCQELVAPGGAIANVGVHGTKVDFHIEKLWDRNITITTRLVDAVTTPMLLRLFLGKTLNVGKLITHRFAFHECDKAYEVLKNAGDHKALKIIISSD